MKLSSKIIAPVVVVMIFGGIAISAAVGHWKTESDKVPITYKEGEFEGQYNPADIRGSYTFADVADVFEIPVELLVSAFPMDGLDNTGGLRVSELEAAYGATEEGEIGTDSMRYFVALYKGLPYTPADDTMLPAPAVSILADKLDEEQLAEVRARSVKLSAYVQESESTAAVVAEHTTDSAEDRTVKGKTTFAELLDWGLTQEDIEGVLGIEMGDKKTTVRNYVTEQGLSFESLKAELQNRIDLLQ